MKVAAIDTAAAGGPVATESRELSSGWRRWRPWAWLAAGVTVTVAILTLVIVLRPRAGEVPAPGEATPVLLAESLWLDHDLGYDHRDAARALERWPGGARGLVLAGRMAAGPDRDDVTLRYGEPWIYPLAALPLFAAFGSDGFVVLNALLLLLAVVLLLWPRGEPGQRPASRSGALFVVSGLVLSGLTLHVGLARPVIFEAACLVIAVTLWFDLRRPDGNPDRRWRLGHWCLALVVALLLAAAVAQRLLLLVVALPLLLDAFGWRLGGGQAAGGGRRWQQGLGVLLVFLLATGVLWAAQWSEIGIPDLQVPRHVFASTAPLQQAEVDVVQAWAVGRPLPLPAPELRARRLLLEGQALLFGRHRGVLLYLPLVLVVPLLLLAEGWRRRRALASGDFDLRVLLAAAVAVGTVLVWWLRAGDPRVLSSLGDPALLALLPTALLAVRPAGGTSAGSTASSKLVAGLLAAALVAVYFGWLLSVAALSVGAMTSGIDAPPWHTRHAPADRLPQELTALVDGRLAGYETFTVPVAPEAGVADTGSCRLLVPSSAFQRGTRGRRAQLLWFGPSQGDGVLICPWQPLTLDVRIASIDGDELPDELELELDAGAGSVRMVIDSPAERRGVPLTLALGPPVAQHLDGAFCGGPEYYQPLRFRAASPASAWVVVIELVPR